MRVSISTGLTFCKIYKLGRYKIMIAGEEEEWEFKCCFVSAKEWTMYFGELWLLAFYLGPIYVSITKYEIGGQNENEQA